MAMPESCSSRARAAGRGRRGGRGRLRGFTLLEVLVALTIIAVALSAALRGALALTGNARDVDLKLYATITAENQVLEMRLARSQAGVGDTQFDCEQGGVRFLCTQNITATPNPFFRRVEVHVATRGDGAREYADLMGLLPVN